MREESCKHGTRTLAESCILIHRQRKNVWHWNYFGLLKVQNPPQWHISSYKIIHPHHSWNIWTFKYMNLFGSCLFRPWQYITITPALKRLNRKIICLRSSCFNILSKVLLKRSNIVYLGRHEEWHRKAADEKVALIWVTFPSL